MHTLTQSLDFLVAHPAYQLMLNWIVLYEALLPRATDTPPPITALGAMRWHLWFALCEDNPRILGVLSCWIAQPSSQLRNAPPRSATVIRPDDSTGNLSGNRESALVAIDARLAGLQEVRRSLSQAITETRNLRRAVAYERTYRSQELVVAKYAAIYQYVLLSQPDYPLGRLLTDERLRAIACGCPEGACEHFEYLSKRLSSLSMREPGRPSFKAQGDLISNQLRPSRRATATAELTEGI